MSLKKCTKCKIEKEQTEFYKNKNTKDGLDCNCKECRSKINANYYMNHINKFRAYYRTAKNDLERSKKIYDYRKKLIKEGYFKEYYIKNLKAKREIKNEPQS